ncbi:MAG: serine hydrolase domain-containing protein [Oscillochloridaceae bacterium umkhey_bin13]
MTMPFADQIAAQVADAIATRILPGAVVLADHGGRLVHWAAYGTTMYADPGSRPLLRDDIFDLASLTKVVTATAALVLCDGGALRLDDELVALLPGVRATGIRVRHLLTHSSGLDLRLSALKTAGAAGLRAAVWAAAPIHPPGTVVAYTNINSLLLGEVIAQAASLPLATALQTLVLQPLGMHETGFCPATSLQPRIVPTEWDPSWRGGLVHGVVHDESAYALGGVAGHAGLFGTATDLRCLLRLWLQGGTWAGRQILREETVAEALRDQTVGLMGLVGAPQRGGLGWMLDRPYLMGAAPPGSFGHTGFTGSAIIGVPAHDLALVVLSNRTYPQRTPPPYRHHATTAAILGALLETL